MNNLRRWLLKAAIPITKGIGKIHAPFSHKRCRSAHAHEIANVALPGYVLLTHTRGEFTNLFIPGYWTHAAIMYDKFGVIEAVGDGVRMVDIHDFVMSKDDIVIMRNKFGVHNAAAMAAASMVGRPYDFLFEDTDQAFYCAELVIWAYLNASGSLHSGFWYGTDVITPQDIYKNDDFEVMGRVP